MVNHLEEAKQLKDEFKIREALDAFEKALQEDDSNIEIIANIALCNMMMGNIDKSKAYFEKATAIDKDDELLQLYFILLDVATGKDIDLSSIKIENLDASEQFMASAEMFYAIRLREEAFRLFEAIISQIKDEKWLNLASNQYRIVTMLAKYGFFIEAKEIAETLVSENSNAWHGHASLGQIELEQGNVEEAKAHFKQALLNGGDKDSLVIAAISDTRLLEVPPKEKQ